MKGTDLKIVSLYIKTHNDTGLKYFGKTVSNPFTYQGSGTYWKNHLKKHGNDVSTKVYGRYLESDPNLKKDALLFSMDNNIVDSNEWANLIVENGLDGGSALGHCKGYFAINNGEEMKTISGDLDVPNGWVKGSLYSGEKSAVYGTTHSDESIVKMMKPRPSIMGKLHPHSNGISNSHRDNISKGKTGKGKGNENPNSKTIYIFNNEGDVMFKCYGNLKEICSENNLPINEIIKSHHNNGSKIYQTPQGRGKAIQYNRGEFIGWSAKEIVYL